MLFGVIALPVRPYIQTHQNECINYAIFCVPIILQ